MTENLRRTDQCHRTVADLLHRLSVNRVEPISAIRDDPPGAQARGERGRQTERTVCAIVDHGAFETPSLPRAERYDPG